MTANVVYPVTSPPILNGMVVVDREGFILDIVDPQFRSEEYQQIIDSGKVESFQGALVPGFINAHCHLELSHLRGKITEGTGLPDFLKAVSQQRTASDEIVLAAMQTADQEMWSEGIVAVGDISNRAISLDVKKSSPLTYHTFVEVYDLHPDVAAERFAAAVKVQSVFSENNLSASIVPHAPYTVSEKLMSMIGHHAHKLTDVLTIHHAETSSEKEMFMHGTGNLADFLSGTGRFQDWSPKGISSLSYTLQQLPDDLKLLLVHNTFSSTADFDRAAKAGNKLGWCLCPNANLYIEKVLPPLKAMQEYGLNIMLGTDSLSSNHRLSMLEEMKALMNNFNDCSLEQLLIYVTISPARFFGWEQSLGSVEVGKRPGLNLLADKQWLLTGTATYSLSAQTEIHKII